LPLFAKEGDYSSLWKREDRRDFTKQCCHYYETVNNSAELLSFPLVGNPSLKKDSERVGMTEKRIADK